ncbi:hypothetical protein DEU56DRAFT_364053 [Suillus clintonianus]|uniref:uncharacterized protein n=1 Tax=Suillus clintonianus TaxID=1904413 RepID=UPI001B883459|nr:uncharacterized protein DEU56DRAFT_364053 [Suillus clintonianus]KAG2136011.1 hypothetical protein DEU56DRAFT_364053 [Suillus clintonianus]
MIGLIFSTLPAVCAGRTSISGFPEHSVKGSLHSNARPTRFLFKSAIANSKDQLDELEPRHSLMITRRRSTAFPVTDKGALEFRPACKYHESKEIISIVCQLYIICLLLHSIRASCKIAFEWTVICH